MISLIIGPMFSGKTTELRRRLMRSYLADKKVVIVRSPIDNRGKFTHDLLQHNFREIWTDKLKEIFEEIIDYDVIGVDEGQFFQDLAKDVDYLANLGKVIIISGLNGTSERKPFKEIQNLIPLAEEIVKLNAVCTECGSDYGNYSFYKGGVKTEDVKIGDQNLYTALCRLCYNKANSS